MGRSLPPRTTENILYKRKKISELRACKLKIDNQQLIVVVDPGSEAYLLSEELFEKLTAGGNETFHIPIMSAISVSAWCKLDKEIQK